MATVGTIGLWDAVADERRGLADLLDALTPDQLATPSLCAAWTVRDVAAHLVAAVEIGMPSFAWTVLTSRGDVHAASRKCTALVASRPVPELAGALRRKADQRSRLRGPEGPLTDILVHGQDIRRPLGLSRRIPESPLLAALRFLTEQRTVGFVAKGVLSGLSWQATDLDWSHGTGPAVQGPAEALLLAITGRPAALPDLQGEGTPTLKTRLTP